MLFYFVFISTVKPTVPIFYVNSNKLDGLPYRREDYQHQCFGNVGKSAGQLVIEFQPFNTSSFKAIPSSNLVILQNSTRNIDCDNFQNLTFRMNLTTEIEHGKLRCRVINDEILIDELVASEEDLSAWPRKHIYINIVSISPKQYKYERFRVVNRNIHVL